jgi:hypothetical protein
VKGNSIDNDEKPQFTTQVFTRLDDIKYRIEHQGETHAG